MALIDRLVAADATKIPVHPFMAACGEWERGKMSRQQVIDAFGLLAGDLAELDALNALVKTPREAYPLSGRVVLTNVGATYDANVDSLSLPFVYIQRAGVTRLDVEVRNRKAATQTGTIDYQLWDETNASAAIDTVTATTGSLSDAAAAGDHTLIASRTFAVPLAPGVVKLRLRCKCTTAADDPTFLNASLLLTRVDTITADVLHQVLLLGENDTPPLNSAAALRTRLGLA